MTDIESFNISKTEFKAYLECPFKFYLIKDLNQGKPFGPRGRRDYSGFSPEAQRGMKWHYWFMDFHKNHSKRIIEELPSPTTEKADDNRIIKLFYEVEVERYKKNPDYWFPVKTEWYLQNDLYRGQIDRVDQLNKEGRCRVVEYKPTRKQFDEQEVLFYAKLLADELTIVENNMKLLEVTEVAIYYYETGEFWRKEISQEDFIKFEQFLLMIREEMLIPNWVKKENCYPRETNCVYRDACEVILL